MPDVFRHRRSPQSRRGFHVLPVVVDVLLSDDAVRDRPLLVRHAELLAGAFERVAPIVEGERERPQVEEMTAELVGRVVLVDQVLGVDVVLGR